MRVGWCLLVPFLATLASCHPTPGEKAKIRDWLLCEECTSGELQAVVALGDRATGELRKALLEGPPESDVETIRAQSRDRFRRLPSPTVIESVYLAHYDSSYISHYRRQAATALGQIAIDSAVSSVARQDARAALLEAMQRDTLFDRDVLRALSKSTRVSIAGDSQAAPRDSFVRINPTVMVRDSGTGQPLANVRVTFVVDSGGGRVTDSVLRTSADGLAATRWALGPGPDSFNVLRATTLRRSVRFHATSHGLTPRLVFTVQPTDGRSGQSLPPPPEVVVLDAWDQRDSTINDTVRVFIIGQDFALYRPMVAGRIDLANLVPHFSGKGFRLRVMAIGVTLTPAVSDPFGIK